MSAVSLRSFGVFFNRYYWQTVVLVARNGLARQYRNSFLGMLWMLLQPMTMVLVYSTIMPLILRQSSTQNYALYIIVALPIWNFFSMTLIHSAQSILVNGEVLKRCIISSTVFPVADVLRNAYSFFVAFFTMQVLALVFGVAKLNPYLLLMPIYFLPVLITICAVAVSIAFIAPFIRDIGEFVILSMTIIFWLTPIIYGPASLPPEYMRIMEWNPFYIMMHPLQMLAYDQMIPDAASVLRLLGLMLVAIIAGFGIFRACRRNYVYYL